jgi:LacI family transcriptional regulator
MSLNTNVTIKQVAEEAGVSIQTVSRVINKRYDVAAETRQRVQEAINRLGYQPNAIARGLASKRSRTLGLVTYDFNDYAFTQVVTGAEVVAHQHGYFFMLGSSKCDPCDEPKYLQLLTERHVEGVLFLRQGSLNELEFHNDLISSGVPVVVTGYHRPNSRISAADVDNLEGGRMAAECLLQHGHRRIACVTGPLSAQSAIDRLAGYRAALEAAGVPFDEDLIAEGNYNHHSGYLAMTSLLEKGAQFSGVFCQNDRMAIGAISALREAGLRIPEDVSVVGYDDCPEAEFADPPLTTMRQNMVEMGSTATELLIQQVENPGGSAKQVLMHAELVTRASVIDFRPGGTS